MTYLQISRVLVTIASIAITAGLYAQVLKIWTSRSAKDFSLVLVLALVANELAWLNYGLALREWPIVLVGCANVPAIVASAIGYARYRK